METHKLLLCALVLTSTAARQDNWRDIFALYPLFENEDRFPIEQFYPSPIYKDPMRRAPDNLLKRQDADSFQRTKLAIKTCTSCCCTALYKPRNIILGPDIYVTVMEVSGCNSTCPGVQKCTKIASTIEWSKMGFPVNNTAVFTACTCGAGAATELST